MLAVVFNLSKIYLCGNANVKKKSTVVGSKSRLNQVLGLQTATQKKNIMNLMILKSWI